MDNFCQLILVFKNATLVFKNATLRIIWVLLLWSLEANTMIIHVAFQDPLKHTFQTIFN